MLNTSEVVAFVATTKPDDARKFYGEVLGLQELENSPFAMVFDANGTTLRVQKVESIPPLPYTVLGWEVKDIVTTVKNLARDGVRFERFDKLPQDELGIWETPDGSRVAWFKDPDDNTLSVTQYRAL